MVAARLADEDLHGAETLLYSSSREEALAFHSFVEKRKGKKAFL